MRLKEGADVVPDNKLLVAVLRCLLEDLLCDLAVEYLAVLGVLLVDFVQCLVDLVLIQCGRLGIADLFELGEDGIVVLHQFQYNLFQPNNVHPHSRTMRSAASTIKRR